MEALYLHMSVQPVEPQTRVKSGRNAFFLPDFQFIFNMKVLQLNKPKKLLYNVSDRVMTVGYYRLPSWAYGLEH